jgi:hypothetical protein
MVEAAREMDFTEDDVVVVILPDSIRSYLSKVCLLLPLLLLHRTNIY